MRLFLIGLLVMAITAGTAFAQLEKGNVRLGLQANITAVEDASSMMLAVSPGFLVSDNIEIGGSLSLQKITDIDVFGGVGGGLVFHFTPQKKVVPGVGFQIGRTFGLDPVNATTIMPFFNLDAFIADSWAITFQSGYQRQIYEGGSVNAFILQVGISAFIKK